MLRISILLALCALSATSYSQVTLQVSLDPTAPAGRVTADVHVDVATTDAFLAGGIRAIAMNGATFHYGGSDDPNTPYPDYIAGPYGVSPVTDTHVTSISRPRGSRNGANRFNSNSGGNPHARYSPDGLPPTIVANSNELNVAWLGVPIPGPTTQSEDGYIARISIDFVAPAMAVFGTGRLDLLPPAATIIMLSQGDPSRPDDPGVVSDTYDFPGIVGFDWAIWYEAPCIGDLDDSGEVNLNDLTTLLGHFGFPGILADGDIDGNGVVDLVDLTYLLGNFGAFCP